jgi:hypothetical protein
MTSFVIHQGYNHERHKGIVGIEPNPDSQTAKSVWAAMTALTPSNGISIILPGETGTEISFIPTDYEGVIGYSILLRSTLERLGHLALPTEGIRPLEATQRLLDS